MDITNMTVHDASDNEVLEEKIFKTDYGTIRMLCRGEPDYYAILPGLSKRSNSGEYFSQMPKGMLEYIPTLHSWLDVGAHIGSFSIRIAKQFGMPVVAMEPYGPNYDLLVQNIEINDVGDLVTPIFAAAVPDDTRYANLFISPTNAGAHNMMPKRGRSEVRIRCKNINTMLIGYGCGCVKLDVEGYEYDLLKNMIMLGALDLLVMEFHSNNLRDMATHEKYYEIVELLQQNFPYVQAPEPRKLWRIFVYAWR